MAKLVSFTICESLNNTPSGNFGTVPVLISPQIVLRPQFIPGNFSFGIAVGISEVDIKVSNKVKFTITGPDGNVLNDSVETDLPVVVKPDSLPDQYQGFMLCIDIRNLAVPCEGAYTFSLYLNGDQLTPQCIPIYKRSEQ